MAVLIKRSLIALLIMGAMAMSVRQILASRCVPSMMRDGNLRLLAEIVQPLEKYYADHQEWPAGSNDEVFLRLRGATDAEIAESQQQRAAKTGPGMILRPTAAEAFEEATQSSDERAIAAINYMRGFSLRSLAGVLVDAWLTELKFDFPPHQPALITSAGPDLTFGTADDQSVAAQIMPRQTGPTRQVFAMDLAMRRLEELRRAEQAWKKAGQAAKSSRSDDRVSRPAPPRP